jgi:hypothetical protein
MTGILGSRSTCEAYDCKNKARYLVNARYVEAQSGVCGVHLASYVAELGTYRGAKRRGSDHGVMIYPIRRD